jgi:hypothetical protein
MIRHDNESVQLDAIFASLVLKDVEEESRVLFDLEESSTGCCDGGDEVGSELLWG